MTDPVVAPPPLDRRYTIAWLVLLLLAVAAEMLAPRSWYWGGVFGLGVVLEIVAALRSTPGDTLSEQVFAWEMEGPTWRWARTFLIAGGVVWISVRFYEFGGGPGGGAARAALAGGLCGWLALHWVFRGRYG